MPYVDGYVLAVKTAKMDAYKKIAQKAGKVWKEHGALQYCECVGEDMDAKFCKPFPKMVKPKEDETVVFSFIVFKSRKQRDTINAKVMADPRLAKMMDPNDMPFDCKRMVYGGFETLVSL